MDKKCRSFLILACVVLLFSFCKIDSIAAMEQEPNPVLEAATEAEPLEEPVAEPETEAEPSQEPAEEPETNLEPGQEPADEPETNLESSQEPADEPETNLEPGQEPADEPETNLEPSQEPADEPETDLEPSQEPADKPESEPEQTVSTGQELIQWLEAHKNTGGRVKLTDHVVLDGEYSVCLGGIGTPAVFVDTDIYTITVIGETELLSDGQVIFSGQPSGKGIFYVAEKSMLSMQGIVVESGQCALWQEEGAGLVISDCHIAGSVHYADTPFVVYHNAVCAIVGKGQTLNDVLPEQISCTVNRQGQVSHSEWVSLSWNLEGTGQQQESRRRFELQGSFLHAVSAEPVQCTVVYDDYPLTFTEVKASISGSQYLFRGNYTKPEEALPITVITEYSFDGENWFIDEETKVTDTYAGFFIVAESEQRSRAACSNIYIRLQWNDDGTGHFSNVLCYAADNLETAEDMGGSRGGGTSIVNPPEEPQKTPIQSENTDSGSDGAATESSSGKGETEKGGSDNASGAADDGQALQEETLHAETANTPTEQFGTDAGHSETEQPLHREPSEANTKRPLNAENVDGNAEPALHTKAEESLYAKDADTDVKRPLYAKIPDTEARQALYAEPGTDIRQGSHIILAAGIVLLSVIVGIAAFYVHSRSGTNR